MLDVASPHADVTQRYPITPDAQRVLDALYDRVRDVIPAVEWAIHAPLIHAINTLKREKNAVILAHNYQTPEIYFGVADIVGDSLQLARKASDVDADRIIMCGVHFMAETAKIMNPDKTVLIPDLRAGCSLAESITAADVRLMKEKYPGRPVVTYVNTSADVKAESDVCCTSSNAVKIVNALNVPEVIFLPDQYLGAYVATQTETKIITWAGSCEVHERFTGAELRDYRTANPGVTVLAHPECPQDVLAEADYVGSTAQMSNYVQTNRPNKVVLITECSMSDNVAVENPDVDFVRPCNLCPHMKRITLENVYDALINDQNKIEIDVPTMDRARQAVTRMLELS